jgi:hypothetical protein
LLSAALGEWAVFIGVGYAAVLWALLGYIVFVRSDSRQPTPTPLLNPPFGKRAKTG